jgi:hypothetical protein
LLRWEASGVERGGLVCCAWACSLWYCREIGRGCVGCGGLDVAVVDDAVVVAVVGRVHARRLRDGFHLPTSSRSCWYSTTSQQQRDHPIERQHWEQLAHCDWQGQSAIVAEKLVAIAIAVAVDSANEHCQVVQSATASCTFDVWKVCIERTCRDA